MKEIRAVLVCGLCSCSLGYRQEIPEEEIKAAIVNVLAARRRRMVMAVVDRWLADHSHGGEAQLAALSLSTVDVGKTG